jgi:hypothetical protein
MGGERDVRVLTPGRREPFETRLQKVDARLDEARVVVEGTQAKDVGCLGPDCLLRLMDVLPVLAAARIAAEPLVKKARARSTPAAASSRTASTRNGRQLRLPR